MAKGFAYHGTARGAAFKDSRWTAKKQWEDVYRFRAEDAVIWYRPHLETSLTLIAKAATDRNATIVDVGAGASTLVDDLLNRVYRKLTVLDMSAALRTTKRTFGFRSRTDDVVRADLTATDLPTDGYHIWHDRAVFHLLTDTSRRATYVRLLTRALKTGGHLVVATFGPTGPTRRSRLDGTRYESLSHEIGNGFELVSSMIEDHQVPAGVHQRFLYCCFRAL